MMPLARQPVSRLTGGRVVKRLIAGTAAAALVVLGTLTAAPAYAAYPCGLAPSKTSTRTTVVNNGCDRVQAGIWRYIGSSAVHYISPWRQTTAIVDNSNGYNAGNDYRGQVGYPLPDPPGPTTYAWTLF